MSALSRFESFMENMVEGSVARLFRSPIQPSEIAKRLERAMEAQQMVSVKRVIVPNLYHVYMNPQDHAAFQPIQRDMERELANYLVDLAQERGFSMLQHPHVELLPEDAVNRRGIQVVAEATSTTPASSDSQTKVFQAPGGQPRARLVGGKGTAPITLESTQITIGRGLDNDIILEDTRVSRHHAQLRYRARRFWLSDLGSTNGTYVNNQQVEEKALADGDTISLGGLELVFRDS